MKLYTVIELQKNMYERASQNHIAEFLNKILIKRKQKSREKVEIAQNMKDKYNKKWAERIKKYLEKKNRKNIR